MTDDQHLNSFSEPPSVYVDELSIYAEGLCAMSVCVPSDWSKEDVEIAANAKSPAGDGLRWKVSEDEKFASGQPNPCPCEKSAESTRIHYLLNC